MQCTNPPTIVYFTMNTIHLFSLGAFPFNSKVQSFTRKLFNVQHAAHAIQASQVHEYTQWTSCSHSLALEVKINKLARCYYFPVARVVPSMFYLFSPRLFFYFIFFFAKEWKKKLFVYLLNIRQVCIEALLFLFSPFSFTFLFIYFFSRLHYIYLNRFFSLVPVSK